MSQKILVVDDSGSTRKVTEGILRNAGFKDIILAGSGELALVLVEKEHPDLVLLDIVMPEMSGMEVLKRIAGKTKVVIISAVGQEEMVDHARELGAVGYIVKPFDEAGMIRIVKNHLASVG